MHILGWFGFYRHFTLWLVATVCTLLPSGWHFEISKPSKRKHLQQKDVGFRASHNFISAKIPYASEIYVDNMSPIIIGQAPSPPTRLATHESPESERDQSPVNDYECTNIGTCPRQGTGAMQGNSTHQQRNGHCLKDQDVAVFYEMKTSTPAGASRCN